MNNKGQDLINEVLVFAMIAGFVAATMIVVAVKVRQVFAYIGEQLAGYTH